MTTRTLPHAALRALLLRATVLWALLRMLVAAAVLMAESMSASASDMSTSFGNPVGLIVLCSILGIVDIRRRQELVLWGNLGLSATQLATIFALVAGSGELLLSLGLR